MRSKSCFFRQLGGLSAPGSGDGRFADGGEDFFRVPVVGGIPGEDPAIFSDEDGR